MEALRTELGRPRGRHRARRARRPLGRLRGDRRTRSSVPAARGSARRARSRRARPRAPRSRSRRSRIGFTSTTSSEPSEARLGDELEREVRLAVREPAAHRRADAGRDVGIDDVHVEAHVDEARRRRRASSASRIARSTPSRSTSLIVKTRAPSSPQRARARPRRASGRRRARRAPDRRAGSRPRVALERVARRGRAPRRAPSRGRSRVGERLRACSGRRARRARARRRGRAPRARPPSEPSATEWSPPSTSGSAPVVGRARHERRDPLARRLDLAAGSARARRRPSVASATAACDVAPVHDSSPELARAARRAPRSGSRTAPCRRRADPRRGRAARRSRRPAARFVSAHGGKASAGAVWRSSERTTAIRVLLADDDQRFLESLAC